MQLQYGKTGKELSHSSGEIKKHKPKKPNLFRRAGVKLAAFASSVLLSLSPMATNTAMAQEAPPQPTPGRADGNPNSQQAPENSDDGTYSGENAQQAAPEIPPDTLFRANFLDFQPMGQPTSSYQDTATAPSAASDISETERRIPLDNDFSIGGRVIGNPAGTAILADASYRDLVEVRAGNIWFYDIPAPFGNLRVTPQVELWRFKLKYFGTLTGMYDMPSYLYSTHSGLLGFSYPVQLDSSDQSRQFWIRLGGVGGGAFSYPKWDDIYFNLVTGLSFQLTGYPRSGFDYLIYGMVTSYAAAETPPQSAYIGNYGLRYQNVEFGFQARIFDDYTLLFFGKLDTLYNEVGFRGTWSWTASDNVQAKFWVAAGARQWDNLMGGDWEPSVGLGATVVYGGSDLNSENSTSYVHDEDTSLDSAEMDLARNSGLHGFGLSGDSRWDIPINRAKTRILTSGDFDNLVDSYPDADTTEHVNELVDAARFFTAFLGDEAYATDAMEAMFNLRIFDDEVQRIANAGLNDIFLWMKAYINWRASHPGDPLPDELQGGIAVCAGIHWFAAEFLNRHGIPAAAISVNAHGGPHVVTIIYMPDGKVALMSYGEMFIGENLRQALFQYSRFNGTVTENSQVSPAGEGYHGTYITPEGRLLHYIIGVDNEDVLREQVLGVTR